MRSSSFFIGLLSSLSLVSAADPAPEADSVVSNAEVFGLGIPVTNTAKSLEFYTKTLDLGLERAGPTLNFLIYQETILRVAENATNAKYPGSGIVLLEYPGQVVKHGDVSGKVVFYVDNVPAKLKSLNKKGVKTMLDFGELALVKDPDGFVIEIMQRKVKKT
jgi:catechol 2,3-dioxygenase-like lactoylglutathione lyase family enzyme